ncbi:uncharacterized protein LOC116294804 [Actinia tenebrosa]|uniref:Uncharacterized protein LOC116294804 n=1 Tax=Actinia tenebrosa TaxID=6105 RepID=A0A6P8I071_ACTTE|nr:uncharacterized protein LOC116294804 [Actinia tenebrosa]
MATGRVSMCCIFFYVVARLICLIEQPGFACNNSKEFSFHLWRTFKVNLNICPRLIDGKPRVYSHRDFTRPASYMAGLLLLCGDVATQPGPYNTKPSPIHCSNIKCLYMNSRSVVSKHSELQALSIGQDLIFCVESWLKEHIRDCELLPSSEFTIHRRDRKDRRDGGVFLAARNNIMSIRRKDLETDAEISSTTKLSLVLTDRHSVMLMQ